MIKINKLQKYFFNGLLLSLSGILINAVSVGFNAYVTSVLGPEGMGLITLTSGIYGFSITFATSGINLAVVRRVSAILPYDNKVTSLDDKRSLALSKIMKNAIIYCLFFSFIATLVLFFCASPIGKLALGDARTIPSLKVMALSLVPISISSALNGYFCAVRRVYKNVVAKFLEQGVKICAVTLLLINIAPWGLEYSCVSLAIGTTISEFFSLIVNIVLYFFDRFLHRENEIKEDLDLKANSLDVFSIAFPVAVSSYARSGLSTLEHLLIPWGFKKSGATSSGALASYGILHGMVFPLLLFPSSILGAFSSLLVPELSSSLEKKDFSRIKYIVAQVFYFTLIFSLGVSGILICFSEKIGVCFYNSYEAGKFIRLLAPLIPLMYLDGAVDSMLKGLGEQIYSMRVNILDSLLSILLIVILLPCFGVNGYIGVIFITELFNTTLSILRLLRVTGVKTSFVSWLVKPLICISLSTIISSWIFSSGYFSSIQNKSFLIFEISFVALLYILFSVATGVISKKERGLIKRLIKSN
ncbi:MAG: oligosaccharide flippase family protein [Clostridia bacterium]|nr:oligosaccharide flippase family protein [Clostridia bacterium]